MEITTVYQKERKEFGRNTNHFTTTDVVVIDEFPPEQEIKDMHIERNPTILDIQAIPDMTSCEVRKPAIHCR